MDVKADHSGGREPAQESRMKRVGWWGVPKWTSDVEANMEARETATMFRESVWESGRSRVHKACNEKVVRHVKVRGCRRFITSRKAVRVRGGRS
eukprot:360315-Chlamydomonas_euryale.AAC.5